MEYPYGNFCDGKADCQGLVPFDAKARSDFDEVTRAVERSGVELDRIYRNRGAIYFQFYDSSWQYDWFYVYLPDAGTPPAKVWPEEEWTHIRGNWWFYRGHDD